MKTPLPELLTQMTEYQSGSNLFETKEAVNQLITYLAELTEVVEKKQEDKITTAEQLEEHVAQYRLKETLLGEILALPARGIETGNGYYYFVKRDDVEAIINRLMP